MSWIFVFSRIQESRVLRIRHRVFADVELGDVDLMLGQFVLLGFSVSCRVTAQN
jgi:hypothetical protein